MSDMENSCCPRGATPLGKIAARTAQEVVDIRERIHAGTFRGKRLPLWVINVVETETVGSVYDGNERYFTRDGGRAVKIIINNCSST